MGHIKAKKRSSKRAPQKSVSEPAPFIPELESQQEDNNQATYNLFTTMWETSERTYSDRTGAFQYNDGEANTYLSCTLTILMP